MPDKISSLSQHPVWTDVAWTGGFSGQCLHFEGSAVSLLIIKILMSGNPPRPQAERDCSAAPYKELARHRVVSMTFATSTRDRSITFDKSVTKL